MLNLMHTLPPPRFSRPLSGSRLLLGLVTLAAVMLGACQKGELLSEAAPGASLGEYIAPGEWRAPIDRATIITFSDSYGTPTGPLVQRSEFKPQAAGRAVQLIEGGVNFDHAGRYVTGDKITRSKFRIDVPAGEEWSGRQVADAYAAVAKEAEALIAGEAGRELGCV